MVMLWHLQHSIKVRDGLWSRFNIEKIFSDLNSAVEIFLSLQIPVKRDIFLKVFSYAHDKIKTSITMNVIVFYNILSPSNVYMSKTITQ